MPQFEYKIVAGWDGTTVNVEGVSVAGATSLDTVLPILDTGTHYIVRALGQYNVNYQFTPSGVVQNGYPVVRWTFPLISTKALTYFISTYAQGSSQVGKVTVGTRLADETYVEKNAYLFVPYPNVQAKRIRNALYVYDEGVVNAELRIVGDTA